MKTNLCKRFIASFCVCVFSFSVFAVSVGAAYDSDLDGNAQKLIAEANEANIAQDLDAATISGDLAYLSAEGFSPENLSISLIDAEGTVCYALQNPDGATKNLVVTQNEFGVRSGFYHSTQSYAPGGTSYDEYSSYPARYYYSSTEKTFDSAIAGLAASLVGSWIYSVFAGAALTMSSAVASHLAYDFISDLAIGSADKTISFEDYRRAHPQNDTGLEKYFRHDVTGTTNLNQDIDSSYYETWEPI